MKQRTLTKLSVLTLCMCFVLCLNACGSKKPAESTDFSSSANQTTAGNTEISDTADSTSQSTTGNTEQSADPTEDKTPVATENTENADPTEDKTPVATENTENADPTDHNFSMTAVCTHSSSEWLIEKEATCATDGIKHKTCTNCQTVLETASINKSAHTYTNYKCTGCGMLQEGHLNDYLISYVQKHGVANGETISIDKTEGTVLYGLTYNVSGKYFFFSLLDSKYDDFLSIKFTNNKDSYEIAYLQGDSSTGREIYGSIYAPAFTENTPIAVEDYYGPSNERPNAAENARICTCLMLDFLEQYFANNNVGITLNDLGFTSY